METDLNALGTVLDSSFTRSGATSGPVDSVVGLKATISGDVVKVTFTSVANFQRILPLDLLKRSAGNEADAFVQAAMKKAVDEYKEITGKKLTLKQTHTQDDLQALNASNVNVKRTCLYRKFFYFKI